MIPRIISVSNLKGGAGKSTIAVNLACAIRARTGIDTILVDADRQATALKWAEAGSLGIRVTSRVLHEAKPEERHPGLMWVTQIRMLADKNPSVVIDLPPGLEYSLAAVAAISDMILVPVNPSGVDIHSTSAFINLVQKTRQIRRSDKPRSIIVPNRLDRRTAIARKMSLYEQFGEPISPPIGMRSAFVYAFDHGQWVGEFAPRSAAHKEIEQLVSFIISSADGKGATVAAAVTKPSPSKIKLEVKPESVDPAPQDATAEVQKVEVATSDLSVEEAQQPKREVGEEHDGSTSGGSRRDPCGGPADEGLERNAVNPIGVDHHDDEHARDPTPPLNHENEHGDIESAEADDTRQRNYDHNYCRGLS